VTALALALALAGCGRKGALDPPPGGLTEAQPTAVGPDGRPVAAAPAPQPAPSGNKRLPIDWLLD
jgi:predicted small lipoprotein YifL